MVPPHPDPRFRTDFQYDENVNAAYLNLRGTRGQNHLAGRPARRANQHPGRASGDDVRTASALPAAVSQRLAAAPAERAARPGLAVARRIDRPSYAQLNPLRHYLDATSYRAGNPDLVRPTSYNFELTHTYRQKYSISLAMPAPASPL